MLLDDTREERPIRAGAVPGLAWVGAQPLHPISVHADEPIVLTIVDRRDARLTLTDSLSAGV